MTSSPLDRKPGVFVIGGDSYHNPAGSKWTEPGQATEIPLSDGAQRLDPVIRKHTEVAAKYSRFYHEKNTDGLLSLLSPTCQYGTFFGFVWGPTAIAIAVKEEHRMQINFVGRIMSYEHHHSSDEAGKDPSSFGGGGSSNPFGSATRSLVPGAANRLMYGATDAGLHRGPGAPSFVRVTPNIFERDGYAKRSHRSFPLNIIDQFITLRVRETIVVDDGLVQSRVLQNLTSWFPMPYDFM